MPTIAVDKYDLFKELGEEFTTDGFQELCFDFGIELDDDTEHDPSRSPTERPQLKIEIPANRYDLLCFEGLVLNLNIFRGRSSMPHFRLASLPEADMISLSVSPDTAAVRPLVAGAVLRNISFTPASYASFIGLQDKLHQNLARQRTLVSIGTHDLDTIRAPFTYQALSPSRIAFVPLNQTRSMDGAELMAFYQHDKHLGRYLHIIRESPVYPVIYDASHVVCSLPPIINGNHSKITLETKNVFIEVTATDATKLDIIVNMVVTMFSCYCADPYSAEPIRIVSDHNASSRITPQLAPRTMHVQVAYLNSCCGLNESAANLCKLLKRMAYDASPEDGDRFISVQVPPTRADVLHPCDVMEDVAIAYGFNKLPRTAPTRSVTVGQPLPINKLSDIVRLESAMSGWSEVLPLTLCSHNENFEYLQRLPTDHPAVVLENPKSVEYQVVRTSLLPGLLKTIRENRSIGLPIRIFEVGDIVVKDSSRERRARNIRRWAAAYCGKTSDFGIVHGLLDRVLAMLKVPFTTDSDDGADGYFLLEDKQCRTFLPGRAGAVMLRTAGQTRRIGELGIIDPKVLVNFDLRFPVSVLEIEVEVFL